MCIEASDSSIPEQTFSHLTLLSWTWTRPGLGHNGGTGFGETSYVAW